MAVGFAALAPVLATAVRGQGLVAPPPASSETGEELAARLQKTIVFFGVLESAVVFCAVAIMVSPPVWPLDSEALPVLPANSSSLLPSLPEMLGKSASVSTQITPNT